MRRHPVKILSQVVQKSYELRMETWARGMNFT